MDVSLYQAAAAMNAASRWQEVISDNLAAGQVPGFKKQDLSFSAVQAGFMIRPPNAMPGASQRSAMPLAGTTTDFQAGEMQRTGVNTDLAIDGNGFFTVQFPDGTQAYTRNGQFQVNNQGQLITSRGMPVIGDSGPVQLDPNNTAPITISPTGEISQGQDAKGRLKVSEFSNPGALTATGNGFYLATDPSLQPSAATSSTIRQGFLESGNTSSMNEMGNLITAMRLFEANQKVIQTEDDRVSHLITEVANPSP
jgi:flagellar basal-body rod protein FlgG